MKQSTTSPRRKFLLAGVKIAVVGIAAGVVSDIFLNPTSYKFHCRLICLFPKKMSAAEFNAAKADWENSEALSSLNSQFASSSAFTSESFFMKEDRSEWRVSFADEKSFFEWERQLSTVFDKAKFRCAGFEYNVSTQFRRSHSKREPDVS